MKEGKKRASKIFRLEFYLLEIEKDWENQNR